MKIQPDIVDSQVLLKPADLAPESLTRLPQDLPLRDGGAAPEAPELGHAEQAQARAAQIDPGEAVLNLDVWNGLADADRLLTAGHAGGSTTALDAAGVEQRVRHILEPLL